MTLVKENSKHELAKREANDSKVDFFKEMQKYIRSTGRLDSKSVEKLTFE